MRIACMASISALLLLVACEQQTLNVESVPILVMQPDLPPPEPAPQDEQTLEENMTQLSQGADPSWLPSLRRLCKAIEEPEKKETRHTEGSEKWKSLLDVKVKDFRIYSPIFRKWTLAKVDNPDKQSNVRHRGPWYGYGMTVEVTNNSDQVLNNDSVYVWATFKSKSGERVCFANASASRSWNRFGKKGKGAWMKEREMSEWPLRPKELKRYVITRTSCFSALFTETEPLSVTVDVYTRFRPLGGERVVSGPMKTIEQAGGLLRGLPVAAESQSQQLKKRKATEAVKALFVAGDHAMIQQAKKVSWVPLGNLVGVNPQNLPKLGTVPADPAPLTKDYGQLKMTVDGWNVMGWKKVNGLVKQGHKLVSAKVTVSIDSSDVAASLEAAVAAANQTLAAAQADQGLKIGLLEAAKATYDGVKGTEAEAGAKDELDNAKAQAKLAKSTLKAAQKAVKSATKAMAGGVSSFLKSQAKSLNCGSFRLEVGRKSIKPRKGSFGAKNCRALTGGQPVSGIVWFDLERWDMPFALSWKGPGGAIQLHNVQSDKLGKILKD